MATAPAQARRKSRFLARFRTERAAQAGLALMAVVAFAAILAPWLAPFDPLEQNLHNILQGPSSDHLLGTDRLGRDVLSRLLFGGRASIPAAALAVFVAVMIGVPLGLIMGFWGGWWDRIGMRIIDALLTFPGVMLAIALITVLGNHPRNAMIALGVVFSRAFVRLARAEALTVGSEPYVDAARLLGYSTRRIALRHVLPNITPPLLVQLFLTFGFALLAESGLAFIGLGVQPPHPSWGSMLSNASTYMSQNPSLVFPPGIAITIMVLGANLFGDGLRDSLGPGIGQGFLRVGRSQQLRAITATHAEGRCGQTDHEQPLLSVRNLTVGLPAGDNWISLIDNVSFEVRSGQVLAIVGESGSGKSITGLSILNLLPSPLEIREGVVLIDGIDVAGLSERKAQQLRGPVVAMVFQEPLASLNPSMRIEEHLVGTLRRHQNISRKEARARAVELLQRVEIPDAQIRMHAYPHEFSGGMAQRVMIALAIACDPKLIIADEPTTALDVTVEAEILDILRSLASESGAGLVIVTHSMGVVADIADDVAVMYAGEIVESAPAQRLFAGPIHPYTQELLRSMPSRHRPGAPLPSITGSVPEPGARPWGCRFQDRCSLRRDGCEMPQPLSVVDETRSARCILVHSHQEG